MVSTVVLMAVMVASGQAVKLPTGQEVNDQGFEKLGVVEMIADFLSGKTPMEHFKDNDVDNNGCVDFNEILNWISSHKNSNANAIAASLVEAEVPTVPMDPIYEKTMKKIVKQGVSGGEDMKAIFVEVAGKEDGCLTFEQWKQWAGF